jgi:hypothetical protein
MINFIKSKYVRVSFTIVMWATFAMLMSMFYYYLKSVGFIWDNPDKGSGDMTWNSRKVIFALVSLSSVAITIVRVVDIITDGFEETETRRR